MRYFENFPKIAITNSSNVTMLYTNIMARVNFIPSLLNNPALFYQYQLQDKDRPDVIANKYYNNPYRYWIFLYGNNIIDPFWDLPLDSNTFEIYLNDKYGAAANANNQSVIAYTQSTPYQYQKVVSSTDSTTLETTVRYFNIDQATYNSMPSNYENYGLFPDGSSVTISITKQIQTIFDYELSTNENKRNVNIVNSRYATQMEKALESLLSQ